MLSVWSGVRVSPEKAANLLAVCNDEDWPSFLRFGDDPQGEDGDVGLDNVTSLSLFEVTSYCTNGSYLAPLAATELFAFAIFFRWVNLVPRLLQRHPTFSPIILSVRAMVVDVLKWAFLAAWIVLAFSSFFNALYREPWGDTTLPEACGPLASTDNPDIEYESILGTMLWLTLTTVGESPNFLCLRSSSRGEFALPMYILFLLIQLTMLVNTLIAMMANTYTAITEDTRTYFLYLKALQVYNWLKYPPVPPPFNLLSIPYYVIVLPVRVLVCGYRADGQDLDELEDSASTGVGHRKHARSSTMPKRDREFKRQWARWKTKPGLCEQILKTAQEFGRDKDASEEHSKELAKLTSQVSELSKACDGSMFQIAMQLTQDHAKELEHLSAQVSELSKRCDATADQIAHKVLEQLGRQSKQPHLPTTTSPAEQPPLLSAERSAGSQTMAVLQTVLRGTGLAK